MTSFKELSPNPLLTSTVEIRFSSTIKDDDILNIFYPAFHKSFPKIKNTNIPKGLKQTDKTLEFVSDYVLSNDKYSLAVSKNSIAFENIGTYHLWSQYFPVIKENLQTLSSMDIVSSIQRVGLRYASIFNGENNPRKVLKSSIGIEFNSYQEQIQAFSTNLKKDNVNLLLQIIPDAISNGDKGKKTGFYIDIDASYTAANDLKITEKLFDIIDHLHSEEKSLFRSLLNDDFFESLNPKY